MKQTFKRFLTLTLVLSMMLPLFVAMDLTSIAAHYNVAPGKTVTGGGSGQSSAIDGNIDTYWDGGECPTALVLDLEADYEISKIKVVPYYAESGRVYRFNVYYSTDGTNYTLYGAKDGNEPTTSNGFTFNKDVEARYVKVEMTYNSSNPSGHINELMVYGAKVGGADDAIDPNDPDNLAYNKPTRTNAVGSFPEFAVDGNSKSGWTGVDFPKYMDVDLLSNYDISKIVVEMPTGSWGYKIYGSLDGITFDEIANHEHSAVKAGGDIYEFSKETVYRIIRINVIYSAGGLGGNSSVREVKIYGEKSDVPVIPTREKMEFTSYSDWLKTNYGVELPENYTAQDTYTQNDTFEAIYGIIDRLLGSKYRDWFSFEIQEDSEGLDYYELSMKDGKVHIKGNVGVSITTGLNYYLKYYCNVHVSQQTENTKMPENMPEIKEKITNKSPYEVRYAYNYCTLSYTMPFYGYDEWQRELDYLALSGVNLILDTTATEALWVMYLQQFGYTLDEAKNFVCGYAYKAWWLMGNLENYGGSVSDAWIMDTLELARVNQRFMTVLGIQPCLQGFMGTLPTTFETIAADNLEGRGFEAIDDYMVAQGSWSGFTRPPLLKTTYDGYETLADTFYDTQKFLYGDITDYYAGDLAHEGGVIPTDLSRSQMTSEILGYMMDNDEDAVWIIQCWWGNPEKAVLEGFGEHREDHVLVLDLNSTVEPNYANTTSWGGKEWNSTSWVFCMLDNYGGRPGVHGELEFMMKEIIKAYKSTKHMKGIGLVSEGTQMNPVCQELLWEMAWHTEEIDMDQWIRDYATRRYGEENENIFKAWDILLDTAYGYSGGHDFNTNSVINMLPSLSPSAISGSYTLDYDAEEFEKAVELFMEDFQYFKDNKCYVYDVVDLLKQLVSNSQAVYFNTMIVAYNENEDDAFSKMKDKFLYGILLLDEICMYEIDSMTGEWVGRVDDWMKDKRNGDYDDFDEYMMKLNAKAIITAWCSKILHTYAYRQYSGLLGEYNYPMWEEWLNALESGKKLPDSRKFFEYAWNFVTNENDYARKVLDAAGGAINRGLPTIYNEIKKTYLAEDAASLPSIKYNVADLGKAYALFAQANNPASSLNDGDMGSLWISTSSAFPCYAGIKFEKPIYVDEIVVVSETRGTPGADQMQIEVQVKVGGKFQTVYTGSSYDSTTKSYSVTIKLEEALLAEDIKVTLKSKAAGSQIWPALAEIKVMSYTTLSVKNDTLATLPEDQKGVINVIKTTTVGELKAALEARQGEISVVTDTTTVADTEVVLNGMFVILTHEGKEFDRLEIKTVDKPNITPTPDSTPDTLPTAEPTDTQVAPPATTAPSDNNNDSTLIIIVIAVVVLLGAGAAAYFLVIKKKK